MAQTKIPEKVKVQIWLRAGGRCEYPGCNEPLWKDDLTLAKMNRAYLAHIIADSSNGPRGDAVLSEQRKKDFSNMMLLCDTHHRLVDKEAKDDHPVELLRRYKQEHEERIERLTAIQGNCRTHILLLGTRISDRQANVNYVQACEAVLPKWYPADDKGIRFDLADVPVNENDPEFWSLMQKYIERGLKGYLEGGLSPTGIPINHLSIFALAPIPVLIYLGKQLGDIVSADVYQRHRGTGDWQWQELGNPDFSYIIRYPIQDGKSLSPQVALNLSLSGVIHTTEIEAAMGYQVPIYTITIEQPYREFLKAKEQLELFRDEWYKLLSKIRADHGEDCQIHLFPAVPNSVAIEIGRALLPKCDPLLVVYDQNKKCGFQRTITV